MAFLIPDDLPDAKKKVIGALNDVMGETGYTDNGAFIFDVASKGCHHFTTASLTAIAERDAGPRMPDQELETRNAATLRVGFVHPELAVSVNRLLKASIDFAWDQIEPTAAIFLVPDRDEAIADYLQGLAVSKPKEHPTYKLVEEAKRLAAATGRTRTKSIGFGLEKLVAPGHGPGYGNKLKLKAEDMYMELADAFTMALIWYLGAREKICEIFRNPPYLADVIRSHDMEVNPVDILVGEKAVLLKGVEDLLREKNKEAILPADFRQNVLDSVLSSKDARKLGKEAEDAAGRAAALAAKAARKNKLPATPIYIPKIYQPTGNAVKVIALAADRKTMRDKSAEEAHNAEVAKAAVIAGEINSVRGVFDLNKPPHKIVCDILFADEVVALAASELGGVRGITGGKPQPKNDELGKALNAAPEVVDAVRNMPGGILLAAATGHEMLGRAVKIAKDTKEVTGATAARTLQEKHNVTIGTILSDVLGASKTR